MKKYRDTAIWNYTLITIGSLISAIGVYYFKFPNNFCFGGVTGIAVVLGEITPWSQGLVTMVMNICLLVVGCIFLGKEFGIKTIYSSMLMSGVLWLLEAIDPLVAPLTQQPVLEFAIAVFLPSIGSAILFNIGASAGGTDILAMILKKHSGFNVGSALLLVDLSITIAAFLCFDIQTGFFSVMGLLTKTLVINGVIENLNLSKYFNIICDNPEPICSYINDHLGRGATVCSAKGSFTDADKYIIFTVLRRSQAVSLRNYVRQLEPHAFIMISNSSEIIGKGFQSE